VRKRISQVKVTEGNGTLYPLYGMEWGDVGKSKGARPAVIGLLLL